MRYVFIFALLLVGGLSALLITGNRVLVREEMVPPGTQYVHPQSGQTYSTGTGKLLACHYFSGRSVLTAVFHYSSDNVFGKDSCPFIYKP